MANTLKVTKGIGGHQGKSRTDQWITPLEIIQKLGPFDLDPCSPINRPWDTAKVHYTIEDNGLIKPWFGNVWLNPPYGRELSVWMKLMKDHRMGIALIFARTDTATFHNYVFDVADSLFFFRKRLNFCTVEGFRSNNNAGAPSVLIAYGEYNSDRLASSGFKGCHVPINYTPMIIVGVSPTWVSVVAIAVRNFGDQELKPVYEMVERIAPDKVAKNPHWKAKVRQSVQVIRRNKINEISL